ncbi:MAG TPA: ribonuclease Z [Syntrophales bacterium]|nr:ribonuclease Z [Syntrophales bacterium]
MRAIFLGTNGWYDTDTGNTICTLIMTKDYEIILDAGNGFYKIDAYIPEVNMKPVYLFLSHFHLDHIVGLHTLMKFKFSQGLTICGPSGTRDILETFINNPFSASISQLPFSVTIYELPEELIKIPFRVEARELYHPSLTLGYRIEVEGKVISYCPDTGYCENAVTLARSSDLLIAECAYKKGQYSESWPHLNPETAASIARDAEAKSLALIHFDAETYKTIAERKEAERVARKIFKNAFITTDTMTIEI